MSTPTQQTIISAVITQLQGITVANGYNSNIGNNVNEFSTSKFDPDNDVLRTSVVDDDEYEPEQKSTDLWWWELPLTIEIETSGNTSRQDAREMIADVYSCIGDDLTISGNVKTTYPGPLSIETHQDDKKVTKIYIGIIAVYQTSQWSF